LGYRSGATAYATGSPRYIRYVWIDCVWITGAGLDGLDGLLAIGEDYESVMDRIIGGSGTKNLRKRWTMAVVGMDG